jgi:hypothetical protein
MAVGTLGMDTRIARIAQMVEESGDGSTDGFGHGIDPASEEELVL